MRGLHRRLALVLVLVLGGIAALVTASGQAAVTYSVLNIARAGDNIVSVSQLYGGTYNLFAHTLPQYGIEVRWVDGDDPSQLVVVPRDALVRRRGRAAQAADLVGRPGEHPRPLRADRAVPQRSRGDDLAAARRDHRPAPGGGRRADGTVLGP